MIEQQLHSLIEDYVKSYQELHNTATGWKPPLTGFAAAHDPLFKRLKEIIGPTHALPHDFLQDAETVIVFFIPFEESVAKSNIEKRNCSKQWARAYLETNRLINDIGRHIKENLRMHGFDSATVPVTHNFDPESLISDWSHRHIAYVAGLGTFGTNNMLITKKGCCGRIGSLVTNAAIRHTVRADREGCLHKYNGSCGKCVSRCVNEALFIDFFDRHRCYAMCLENDVYHSDMDLTDVCGKCLAGVPCSFINPTKNL